MGTVPGNRSCQFAVIHSARAPSFARRPRWPQGPLPFRKTHRYYRPRGSADIKALVDDGFQAFNAARLSEACHIYADKMLAPESDTTIGLTVAGALTPAGLGGCVIELMERGLIDFVISTGANLYHDLHYALNFTLRRGSPFLDDRELFDEGVIRIYDVLFPAIGAARNRQLRPRLPRAVGPRRSDRHGGSPRRAGRGPAEADCPAARSTRSSPPPRSTACRSTRRRPATARLG